MKMKKITSKFLAISLALFFVQANIWAKEAVDASQIKEILKANTKTQNEAELSQLTLRFRNRIRLQKKFNANLVEQTLKLCEKNRINAKQAVEIAIKAQEGYNYLKKYGFSHRQSRKSSLNGVQEGLAKYQKRIRTRKMKKDSAEKEVSQALKNQLRYRMRNRKGKHKDKNGSNEMKRFRNRKQIRKGKH